jgi:photosystem II stability/assembly factor-like uncharacterized protein
MFAASLAAAAEEPAGSPAGSTQPDYAAVAPLAAKSLLLDAQSAGKRIIAVGERGHVLLSDDQGSTWRQAKVPTRATLTGVWFHDAKLGWAVGHDEVVVRTEDGGENWQLQHSAPENLWPLLDVWFRDADYGIAVGAYGKYLESRDGGRTWTERPFEPAAPPAGTAKATPSASTDDEDEDEDEYAAEDGASLTELSSETSGLHLNAIVPIDGTSLLMVGEAGALYRSDDAGETWRQLASPYDGSFFGGLALTRDSLLAFGLRGNLWRSDDGGTSWRELSSGTLAILSDAIKLDYGTVIVVGNAGAVLVSRDGGETFTLLQQADRKGLQRILRAGADFLVFGETGVRRLEIPQPAQ